MNSDSESNQDDNREGGVYTTPGAFPHEEEVSTPVNRGAFAVPLLYPVLPTLTPTPRPDDGEVESNSRELSLLLLQRKLKSVATSVAPPLLNESKIYIYTPTILSKDDFATYIIGELLVIAGYLKLKSTANYQD